MARCSTLYQCFNFIARNEGTIGLAPHPDDPCKNRLTISIGEMVAVVEYVCTEEMDLMERVLTPVCRTLEAHLEKESGNEESKPAGS